MLIEAPELGSTQHPARLLHPRGRRVRGPLRLAQRRPRLGDDRGARASRTGGAWRRRSTSPRRSAGQPLSGPFARRRRRRAALAGRSGRTADAHGDARCRASRSASPPPIAAPCCSPIRRRGVVGAAHAGWRGALTGVLEAHPRGHGAAWRRARAGSSPCSARRSAQPAYEVGPEFCGALPRRRCRRTTRFFAPSDRAGPRPVRPARLYRRAARSGRHRRVRDPRALHLLPTRTHFFSYRRATHRGEPDYGRLISAIALTP